ncbi:MAG: hypothetical protein JW939_00090 [Candidatus Thermoplasmatota archaeon]|nr:hypothetical protein [Candidatus Thermoplasmatota archaeon]
MPGKGKEKQVLEFLRTNYPNTQGIKCDPSMKEEMVLIELSMDVKPDAKGSVEVSPDLVKIKFEEITAYRRSITEKLHPYIDKGGSTHHYNLFVCASNEKVWLRTYSDISFLYKDKERLEDDLDLLQSNISYLNRIMNRTEDIMVNSLQHGKVSSSLYALGRPQGGTKDIFPHDMVLELNMSDIRSLGTYGGSPVQISTNSPYEREDQNERTLYQIRQTYLINLMAVRSRLIDLFIIRSRFKDLERMELKNIFSQGKDLKDQIFQLQNSIHNHMQIYTPTVGAKKKKKKERGFLERESFETEKELLTRASIRFSLVSEVEHQIMGYSSKMQDLYQGAAEVSSSLSLKGQTASIEDISQTVGGITQKSIGTTRRDLNILLDELSHSRDILSSTIEVLRTFIDTRQREVSEEMSRLMNVLFLVFACIGLADALGNFVILAIEYIFFDDPTVNEVLQWSSFGLMLTLLPLLIGVIFLVLFFTKRK